MSYNILLDKISESFKLRQDMLEEYPWLTMDDFVVLGNYLDWWPEPVISMGELLNKVSRLHLHAKIVTNLGESELETFVLMMVLAYGNYKILKLAIDPNHQDYFIGITKEDLNNFLNTYLTKDEQKTYKKEFIEI